MKSFAWKPVYSVGDADIDGQHKSLIELMNAYYEFQLGGKHDQARTVLAQLLSLTVRHFRDEEARMEAAGYPHLKEHRRTHQELLKSVEGLVREYLHASNSETAAHLANFLKIWLTRHILGSDKKYGPYLRNPAQGDVPRYSGEKSAA